MDPHTSLGRLCMDENYKVTLNDMSESEGDWSSLEYLDTADSGKKKEIKAFTFHRMKSEKSEDEMKREGDVFVLRFEFQSEGGEEKEKVNSRYVVDNVLMGGGEAYVWNEGNKKYNKYKNGIDGCKASASSGGLVECKASASNLRRIQVRDIVKEVKDYLKTYSSARMDISLYVGGIIQQSKMAGQSILELKHVPKYEVSKSSEQLAELFTKHLRDLENNGVSIPQVEVNATFVNSLRRKWLSMNQTQRANNSIKNDSLATLYGKYNYEEGLIDHIYELESTRFTIQTSSSKALISNTHLQDSDSDVEEDTRSSSEFLADLNVEFHDIALLANQKRFYKSSGRVESTKKPMDNSKEPVLLMDYKGKYKGLKVEIAILTKKIDVMSKGKSEKGLVDESFDWDEESVSSEDEGVTRVKAFMSIVDDEPYVGKADARSDYTLVDLHYVEDQRKNLLSKFNSLNQELSSCKSELCDLKNTKTLNCSLQNEIDILNLENKSLKDEMSDLKKVIEKWIFSKVTFDQLLTEQVPGNIIHDLGGRSKKKEIIFSKEVVFTKADASLSETALEITSDSEFECDNQEPLPLLPKLSGAEPAGTSTDVISLADLILTTVVPKRTKQANDKVSSINVTKKKNQTKSPYVPDPCPDKKADSSTNSKSPKGKQKTWFGPCKHYGFRNHLLEDCYMKPKCSTCGSIDHLTKEHPEQAVIKKTLPKLKAQSSHGSLSRKAPMIPKPYIDSHETANFAKKPSSNNRKMENLNEVRVKELRSDNGTEFRNHKLEEFCDEKGFLKTSHLLVPLNKMVDHLGKFDEKADDGFFLGYSPVAKSFRIFDIKRQKMEETYHVTFNEDDEVISKSSSEGDEIIFNEIVLNLKAGVTTRSRIKDSEATSAHECLFVNYLSKIKPKKLIEALEEEG
ncbi:hypothetical protein Tco_1334929 [Tanacetum coccineum]